MLNEAQRIAAEIKAYDNEIARKERERERRKTLLSNIEAELDTLYAERMRLEGQLERAEAPSAQRQGRCDTVVDGHGVVWQV